MTVPLIMIRQNHVNKLTYEVGSVVQYYVMNFQILIAVLE